MPASRCLLEKGYKLFSSFNEILLIAVDARQPTVCLYELQRRQVRLKSLPLDDIAGQNAQQVVTNRHCLCPIALIGRRRFH